MRAHHALLAVLPRAVVAEWRRLLAVAGLTVIAVLAPAVTAYAMDTAVQGHEHVSPADERSILVHSGPVVDQLFPGARHDLPLLVTNHSEQPITTRSVTLVDILVAESAGVCSRDDFTVVSHMPSSTIIPAGQTRELDLPGAITMHESAGDGCQGASLRVVLLVTVA